MNSEHTPPTGAPPPIELVVTSGGDTTDPNDGVLTLREAVETSGVIPRSPSPPGSTRSC